MSDSLASLSPMTPRQVQIVQATFHSLRPIGDQAVALFFVRLFELAPSLRSLFHGEMNRQGRQLIELLGHIIRQLDPANPGQAGWLGEENRAHLARLPARDYPAMEAALVWTLRQVLGAAFSPEVERAWSAFCRRLAEDVRQTGPGDRAA